MSENTIYDELSKKISQSFSRSEGEEIEILLKESKFASIGIRINFKSRNFQYFVRPLNERELCFYELRDACSAFYNIF